MHHRLVARVTAFGTARVVRVDREETRPPGRRRVRVRVTHASLGSTDVMARRGGYLLQPRPGFTPGYDFVGRVETVNDEAARYGLEEGTRVAGILPGMGAHASHVTVPASLLVPVPEEIPSAVAAALPLDLVTARHALDLLSLPERGSVLVQGVTGAVGLLIAQHAARRGVRVHGTASERGRGLAEALGVQVFDYRAPDWAEQVRAVTGGVDGSVDHTGGAAVRRATSPRGRVVRIAFAGRPGHERIDALTGTVRTAARFAARPAERLCSVPVHTSVRRAAYRRLLGEQLALVAAGGLVPPSVRVAPFAGIEAAHRLAERPAPGEKVVLRMTDDGT
ncbi:zinc-binding dehydrogenase [Thermobifida halotolerans]|uniref:Zinc-binding dehydrogenase n=1 Tax=Thermobifida halotolerans TaxID=483545 RepID=A0AA97M5K5_9ACTN|nr:zinc-binding dehydrogenase [Thermobifida halotolerans]UOE21160.1 zinc-binding dehydrogenase [Thermobifida halotolerans]